MKRNLLFIAMFVCFVVLLAVGWRLPVSIRAWVSLTSLALLVLAIVTDPPPPSEVPDGTAEQQNLPTMPQPLLDAEIAKIEARFKE